MNIDDYQRGIHWIAVNDEPTVYDRVEMSGYISVELLAYLSNEEPERVADDVVDERHRFFGIGSKHKK